MAATLAILLTSAVAPPAAAAAVFPPDPTYRVNTVFRAPGGDIERAHAAVLLVPTPLDADGDTLPDVLVQVTVDARIHLRVTKLATTPRHFPLAIEAVLADPRSGSDLRVGFGFDALASTAPDTYEGSLSLISDAERVGSFALDVVTVVPGESLAVTATLFEERAGARVDPVSARVDLSPVPTALHVGLLLASDLGTTTSRLDLVTNLETRATVEARDVRGDDQTELDLVLDRLPNTVAVALNDAGDGTSTMDYSATDEIDLVSGRLAQRRSGTVMQETVARFEQMARSAVLVQRPDGHATFEASSPIGAVEVGTATNGAVARLNAPAYVYIKEDGEARSTNVRLLGLERATFAAGDPLVFDATIAPGPFRVLVEDGRRMLDARIEDLPREVHVEFSPSAQRLSYEGSDPIGSITVSASDPGGIVGRATALEMTLEQVPNELELSYDSSGGAVSLSACPTGSTCGASLGRLEILATSGPRVEPDPGTDGIVLEDVASHYAIAARMTGLRSVSVTTGGSPYRLAVDKAPGPFSVRLLQGARSTLLAVRDLPASITATFDPTGSITYTASAGIGELTATLNDPAGLVGRATRAEVTLRSLPATVNLSWSSSTGLVSADARGDTIGLLEFLITSGPGETLPADRDGIVLRDLADRYVVFGRLTGLKKVTAKLDPPDVDLQTTGGRILRVDLNRWDGSRIVYTRATLDRLTPSVRIRFAETGTKREIFYNASAATNSIVLDSNAGDRGNLHVDLRGPLPASVTFCSAEDISCTPSTDRAGRSEADAGSVRLSASEHTTVNMLDCVRPLTNCSLSNATEYTTVQNLRVRYVDLDADSNDPVGYSGHIFMDTNDFGLNGYLKNIAGNGGFEANFPGGFKAQNRLGKWTFWGLSKTKTGSITCPSGTSLRVRVLGIWIGVTDYLC